MVTKVRGKPGKVRVTFSMPAAIWADTIHLVGDFNNWNTTTTPLRLSEHGWTVTLELDEGHSYQYRYLVNDIEWHNDWNADKYAPNEYGGDNSVVVTPIFEEPANSQQSPTDEPGDEELLLEATLEGFSPVLRLPSSLVFGR